MALTQPYPLWVAQFEPHPLMGAKVQASFEGRTLRQVRVCDKLALQFTSFIVGEAWLVCTLGRAQTAEIVAAPLR